MDWIVKQWLVVCVDGHLKDSMAAAASVAQFTQFSPIVQDAVLSVRSRKRPRATRSPTPENAEEKLIEAGSMRMSEMCRDLKQGKSESEV